MATKMKIPENWHKKVMTINGLVSPNELGVVLPHEHLIIEGWDPGERNYLNSAFMEIVHFTKNGGKTIVDVTSIGMKRDIPFIKRLADHANLQVIVGTGFYKGAWLPSKYRSMNVDELSNLMIGEIIDGIEKTGVHAGIIGEIGISRPITKLEEKILQASAIAQKCTGAAISLHFEIGTELEEYIHAIELLSKEKANLTKVIIGHLIPRPDNLQSYLEISKNGCWLEFDLFGQERRLLMKDLIQTDVDVQISSIRGFIDNGLINQLLISQNVNHIDLMTVNSGDGYAHILKNVVPRFIDYGVNEEEINTIMKENPKRILPFDDYS